MENVEIHCSHVSRKPNEEKFTTRIRIRKKVDKDILFKAKVKIFNADLKSGISGNFYLACSLYFFHD